MKNEVMNKDEETHYVSTTDKATAEQFFKLGFELVEQTNNQWIFKNNK